ncbi:MAG: EAL domain-containing protein [Solobacterium sp.]|nr:EAL domain-containing protein [Solobacterium sp.]
MFVFFCLFECQFFRKLTENYQEILDRLQAKLESLPNGVHIRCRMGVSPQVEGVSLSSQFDRAKTACNMVRGNFKNNLVIYDEQMHDREIHAQRLINDVEKAAEERQFIVYYQPKYDIQVNPPRLRSAEALIRWRHPEFGMISPGEFIPLFEGNGLIHVVDDFVWKEASRQIAEWKTKYGFTVPVSVNLSRADIFDPPLEQNLLDLVSKNNLTTADLLLEVTESAYTDDADQLIAIVQKLRNHGFHIEMDDFGSGYSSLNMLSSLPIDALKMDMKFIQNVHRDNKEFRLIELILDIAEYLGVPVIAEGVEDEEQLGLLKNAGCDIVQGYYFSRPVPPEEFELLIQKEYELRQKELEK